MRRWSMLLMCVAFACGGASSTNTSTSTSTSTSGDVCWPVAPMRLVALEHGSEWEPVAEMQGDGAIYSLKKGGRKFAGRVSNDALLDLHDTPSLTCVHREVGLPGVATKGRYDDHDAYVDGPTRIEIADDGTVSMNGKAGTVKVEGPIAKTRRTAVLLVLAALAQ